MLHSLKFALFILLSAQLSAQSLTDSLKAYYPFTGNAMDFSGFGHHGSVTGASLSTDRFGNPNSAYHFDGNDLINILPTNHLMPTTFPVTISAWVKFTSANTPLCVFATDNDNGNNYGYWANFGIYTLGNMNPAANFGDGGPCTSTSRRTITSNYSVNDGNWHLITWIVKGPTNMQIYVDCQDYGGQYSGSGGNLTYAPSSHLSKIGHYKCGNLDYFFDGEIDEVRFYHRALTHNDVIALYNYPNPVGQNPVNIGSDTVICGSFTMNLNATTPGATSYLWSTGQTSPSISVSQTGTYWVKVSVGSCIEYKDTVIINNGNNIPVNLIDDLVVCEGGSATFTAPTGYLSYSWSTGATTNSITVSQPGTYAVTVVNSSGCIITDAAALVYNPVPTPSAFFSYSILSANSGLFLLSFINNSQNTTTYLWDFGDGSQSNLPQPTHYFWCDTTYTITLIAGNGCGLDTASIQFLRPCGAEGINDFSEIGQISIYPNPVTDLLTISGTLKQPQDLKLDLYDCLGRRLRTATHERAYELFECVWDLGTLQPGVYYLSLSTPTATYSYMIDKR